MNFHDLLLLLTLELLIVLESGSGIVAGSEEEEEAHQSDSIKVINGESRDTITTLSGKNKIVPRSKLWSPYSTVANFLDTIEDRNVTDVTVSTTASDTRVIGGIVSTHVSDSHSHAEHEEEEGYTKLPPPTPIISSIRHYRSRKSFTRVRKGHSTTTGKPLENELVLRADAEIDLDREQGDEPYYQTVSTSFFTSTPSTTPTKVTRKSVKNDGGDLEMYTDKRGSEGGRGGQSHTVSNKNDSETVYGKPYFTAVRERNSTTIQRIKNILKNSTSSRTSGETLQSSRASDSDVEFIYGKENKKPVKSTGTRAGSPPVYADSLAKSLLAKEVNPDDSTNDDRVKADTNLSGLLSYRPSSSLPSVLATGIPRARPGKGNKLRGSRGTRRPTRTTLPPSIPDGQSPGSNSTLQNSRVFLSAQEQDQQPASENQKIVNQNRHTSELYGTVVKEAVPGKLETLRSEINAAATNNNENNEDSLNRRRKEFESVGSDSEEQHESESGDYRRNVSTMFPSTDNTAENNSENDLFDNFDKNSGASSDSVTEAKRMRSFVVPYDFIKELLRMIEDQISYCTAGTAGTDHNLGEGVVDRYAQDKFKLQAEFAVNRANMLTRLWKYTNSSVLNSEYLLHAMVMSIVEFNEDIFGAGNCYDKFQYQNYELYCPYAYRLPEGNILVKDLAVEYKYLTNTSEWFYIARKNAEKVIKNYNQITKGYNTYTFNESAHTERIEDEILNVTYEDGKWSKPYFDCGGGNIWMMTYTVPFFGYKNGTYFFKGTSGIDVDLRRVDIDQCPLPDNSTELNIFAASDKCKNATTRCVAIKGLGFRRGSYRCVCKDGFYFPNTTSPVKHFNGTILEEEYEKTNTNITSLYEQEDSYECFKCPDGCDTCIDNSPCVVSLNWLMRTAILILQCAIIFMLPIVGLFTWKYSDVKVIRAASPVLLRFIVLGAFFIYCTILVMYPSPSVITCTLRVWLREIGFSLAYGALMLKTWRISVIFRVRSAKAVKITDLDLMKRLGMIVAMFTALLVIRTLVAPPVSIVSLTADDLKAWLCKSDWWDHSFTIMELSFLVWGIRLCIVVRKAPSEFNESKFISLAIYNEFLLSLFLNISMLFLQSPANPDLLYIIFFCHVQLTMTLLLCLIFGSKAYMVFRGQGKGGSEDSRQPTSKFISKNRSGGPTTKQPSAHNSTGLHSSTTSTNHDPNVNTRLSEDVQEEFRRLYYQLEELKERNMRLGNRHLVAKITAMQEAADNIISGGGGNGHRLQASSSGCESAFGSSPSKGKNVGLSDISEEENPCQSPSTDSDKCKSKSSRPVAALALVSSSMEAAKAAIVSDSSLAPAELDRKGILCGGKSISVSNNRSNNICVPKSASNSSGVGDGGGDDRQSHLDAGSTSTKNEVHVREDATDIDAISPEDDASCSLVNAVDGDCGNEIDYESIPMKTISTSRHHNRRAEKNRRKDMGEDFPVATKSTKETQQGNRTKTRPSQQQPAEKNLNHTVGSSASSSTKIILDLDDKSRFTEEITV